MEDAGHVGLIREHIAHRYLIFGDHGGDPRDFTGAGPENLEGLALALTNGHRQRDRLHQIVGLLDADHHEHLIERGQLAAT